MVASCVRFAMRSDESELKTIRSKVMFHGNFRAELQITMDQIEEVFENEFSKQFGVDSVISGKTNIKIRINDRERGIECIVNCVFKYHHDDERYGTINIELVTTGLGVKSQTRKVGKFSVVDRVDIKGKVLSGLIKCVQEV